MPDPSSALITSAEALQRFSENLGSAGMVSVDTEFMRTNTYAPQLCLAQVAADGHAWCIDELAGHSTTGFWRSLAAGERLWVMHAARQDLEALLGTHEVMPGALFDTQVAAGLLGHPPQIGYANLVQEELGIQLAKAHTRADWSRRPLEPELIEYAMEDVLHLPALHERISARLEEQGREAWAAEDCAALLDPALYRTDPEQAWHRLGGITRLPPPAQARARALAAWRERRAVDRNRPRQWILADQALFALALAAPASRSALAAIDGLPPAVVRHQGDALLATLNEARASQEEPAGVAGPVDQAAVRALMKEVTVQAGSLGLAPELLATRRELTAMLRGERGLRVFSGWRQQVVGQALLERLPDAAG
ncbi:MAG: ribonuclease D [Chromatiales bacterium]|nr:ribonuclease D [Chromatiales bacterium]